MLVFAKCEICNIDFQYEETKRSKPIKKTCSKDCSYKLKAKTRNTKHPAIEKSCSDCENIFQDTSKTKTVTRCFVCIQTSMVQTRMRSGSYVRTPEQNEKLSQTLLKKYENGWDPNSEENRKKSSAHMKKLWSSGELQQKIKSTMLEKYGEEHWTKTEQGRKFVSDLHKGRETTEETRRRMSISASERIRNKREICYTSARGGHRSDLGFYFRSCWEANFARILNFQNKSWEYEPRSFLFSNGKTYTPDFLCEGIYYEVKGRMMEECEVKLSLMKLEYPEVQIRLIDGAKYRDLAVRYKHLIPNWEGK
jgi:hypothetical protein